MQQATSSQCKVGQHLRVLGVRRYVVPLLVLAFAVSAIFHVLVSAAAASGGAISHEIVWVNQDAGGDPCCPEHGSQPHGTTCSVSGACSLFVPILVSTDLALSAATALYLQTEAIFFDRTLSPDLHPPKFSTNV